MLQVNLGLIQDRKQDCSKAYTPFIFILTNLSPRKYSIMKKNHRSILALLLLCLLFSCKNDDDVLIPPSPNTTIFEIEVIAEKNVFILGIDTVAILEANATNAAGNLLSGKVFTWSSSDQSVAQINSEGLLTPMAAGSAVISAKSEGVTGTFDIEVLEPSMTQVTIVSNQTEFILGSLNSHQFQAVAVDADGQVVTDPEIQWGSLDESILSVNSEGVIAIHGIGTTEVTATFENTTDSLETSVIPPSTEGDFEFEQGGIKLRASIDLPSGMGPFPAVVIVQGSGTATRENHQFFADLMTARGMAVLRYDKRGTGQSGGIFFEVGFLNIGTQRLNDLALDALAGLEFLSTHTKVQADHVGFFGWSQAGWIIPRATAQSDRVDFMAIAVGPVCSIGEEIYYSNLTDNGISVANANAQMSNFSGIHGYDPLSDLQQIEQPGLWVLGGQDESIPTDLSIERLTPLIDDGKPFEIDLKPNGNHALIDVFTGQQIPYVSPPGGMIDWILSVID